VIHLSESVEVIVQPKEISGTQAADELTKWLENLWRERTLSDGITDLRLDTTEKRTTRTSAGKPALPEDENFPDQVKDSGHLRMELPRQVCKRILLTKKNYEDRLKRDSFTEVVLIGRRTHIDSLSGLEVEAWGRLQSLQLLRDLIEEEAKPKAWLNAACTTHYLVENAFVNVFKKSSSASSRIVFANYDGPCQPFHDQFTRHLPRVRFPDAESSYSRDKFVERSLQQIDLINENYDERFHGKMQAVVSYGTYYVAEALESQFDDLFHNTYKVHTAEPDQDRARGRGGSPRGRGGGRNFVPQPNRHCRASFIPTGNPDIDSSRLHAFLRNKGFAFDEEIVEYRLTLALNVFSFQTTKSDVTMALDENCNLTYVDTPDIKWLYVDIVSADKNSSYRPYDCRFKLVSRTNLTDFQSEIHSDDFADVIANHRAILLRSDNNEVRGVHPDFLSRIRFIRQKRAKVYRLAAKEHGATTDAFLDGMAIRINYGTEHSRLSPTGTFQKTDPNRVEVTAVPELPDLRDDDKMRTFFTECWQFAEELGSVLE